MEPWSVYILAGGKSSRFGSDKARALLDGEPLVARLAEQIRSIAHRVTIVAEAVDKYADLGLRTIADRQPGLGPLAGLETAILDGSRSPAPDSGWIVMLSCDMTSVAPSWIELLAGSRRSDSLAVTFVDRAGRGHPFPGLYHVGLLGTVQQMLESRSLAMRGLLEAVGHVEVPVPGDWPGVAQVNTPEDLRKADISLG